MPNNETTPDEAVRAPMSQEEQSNFLWKVIGRYDLYITTTNTKAVAVAAINTIVVGTLTARWTELLKPVLAIPMMKWVQAGLIVAACIGALVSLYFSVRAISPRTPSPPGSLIFFVHVAGYKEAGEYLKKVGAQTGADRLKDAAYQAHSLAQVTTAKFEQLGHAAKVFQCGVIVPVVLVIILWIISSLKLAAAGQL